MAEQVPLRRSSDSSHQRESVNHRDSLTNPNVFSDDFALEPYPTVSDSSSPVGDGVSRSSMSFSMPGRPSGYHRPSSHTQEGSQTSRSSLEYGGFSPLSSRDSRPLSQSFNHALGTDVASDGPKETSRPHRSISTISNFSMPRTQSPYQGATGPSHPYGMYPQDIGLARSSSSATQSTMRMPDRLYAGGSGPSQPYGMYPQNTVPEDEISPPAGTIHPTPGFPGLGQTYRRRFAPDGEEAADLVGPDGYTEQLPPYTRYPNNVPPKNRLSGPVGPIGGTRDQSQNTENDSRTQLGGSQDTLNASYSGEMTSRNLVVEDSLTPLNSPPIEGPEPPSEGGHFKERVKQKGKRRVCFGRIPLWLAMVLLFIFAVLLGAVIGGVLGRIKARPQKSASDDHRAYHSTVAASNPPAAEIPVTTAVTATTTATATLIDAVPVTSSVSLPTLPTGTFTVNLKLPTMSQQCLDSEQNNAWSCVSKVSLNLDVEVHAVNPTVGLSYSAPEPPYRWGAQPPTFHGNPTITVVKDKGDLSMGLAYFFQQSFDKIVVLKEDDFHLSPLKRSLIGAGDHNDHQLLEERDDEGEYDVLEERDDNNWTDLGRFPKPADKPWFCFWNETILEGFIFITYNTNTTDSEPASTNMDFGAYSSPAAESSTASWSIINTTQIAIPSPPEATSIISEISADTRPVPSAAARKHKRQDTSYPNYPKVVKLEERRNPYTDHPPYCQQMQMNDDFTHSPLYDGSGNTIIQHLNETEPDIPDGPYKRRRSWFEILSTLGKRTSSTNNGCQCQWKIA